MEYLLRRISAPELSTPLRGLLNPPRNNREFYRSALLFFALTAFLVHVIVLALSSDAGPMLSNVIQAVLGTLAVLAMLEAGGNSGRFARRTWYFAAAALAAYTAGQAIFTYRFNALAGLGPAGPGITHQFFFFWMIPLLAAAAADSADKNKGFDSPALLDFGQLVLLALALNLIVFGDAAQWQTHAEQMGFLKWKVRLVRDAVVLGCLFGRAVVTEFGQIRALFLRLGTFYLAYSAADAVYLYSEARWHILPGTWLDLLWSAPRLLAVLVALTWKWNEEIPAGMPQRRHNRFVILYWAPVVVPLIVLALGTQALASAPTLWASLIVATLGIASLRLLVAQSRQEQALEQLNSSHNLLHSIIEGTSEAIYVKDAAGRYLLMNSAGARNLGLAPEQIVGKTDREVLAGEADSILKSDHEVLASGRSFAAEDTIILDGASRTFLSTKSPYRDHKGEVIGVLGISVDVTERRRMEQHLRQVQRMESIGTFSAGIAHDFNNLLTVVKGYGQLALATDEQSQIRGSLEQINKAADRGSALTRQLLAFTRQQVLQPRVINLNEVISNLHKILERLIGHEVEIATELSADLAPIKADPSQIEQVLMNLAANARDAMPRGGRLTLQTANVELNNEIDQRALNFKIQPGPYVLLAVSDTGLGMDEKTQSRIFEPFFTTKPPGKGTGLGLATVYGIVKQSGGYIFLQSQLGSGSTFEIYLPSTVEPAQQPIERPAKPAPPSSHQTILVVDDDLDLRKLAGTVLSRAGYTVRLAGSDEEAEKVAALHPGPIHLLLIDPIVSGISGPMIAGRICAHRRETRVLYMRGYAAQDQGPLTGFASQDPYLKKPFTPESLVQKVREALDDDPQAPTTLNLE